MNAEPVARTRWSIVLAATLAGMAAGMQVGKVPPALPWVSAELGLGLVTAGWVASVFNLMGAALAIVTGLVADRLGARGLVGAGVALLALGAAAGGLAQGAVALIAARAVAGFGLVTIAVAAPRLIVAACRPRDHQLALGAWSVYIPAGMALAMVSAAPVLAAVGWRGLWLAHAVVLVALLLLFLRMTAELPGPAASAPARRGWGEIGAVLRRPGPWLVGAIFALYALQFFAMMSWLPTFLIEGRGLASASAALAAALVVAANVIGNLGGAWLLHRGARRWALIACANLALALCGAIVFSELAGTGPKIVAAFAFSAFGGLIPAAALAAAPVHAPRFDQVATVNGVIVQGANVGSLSGPPVMAAVVGLAGGWTGSWWLFPACAAAGIALTVALRAIERELDVHAAPAAPEP